MRRSRPSDFRWDRSRCRTWRASTSPGRGASVSRRRGTRANATSTWRTALRGRSLRAQDRRRLVSVRRFPARGGPARHQADRGGVRATRAREASALRSRDPGPHPGAIVNEAARILDENRRAAARGRCGDDPRLRLSGLARRPALRGRPHRPANDRRGGQAHGGAGRPRMGAREVCFAEPRPADASIPDQDRSKEPDDVARLSRRRCPNPRSAGTASLSSVRPDDMGAHAIKELEAPVRSARSRRRSHLRLRQPGRRGQPERRAHVHAPGRPPDERPGHDINRLCGSGLDAIGSAARAIRASEIELAIAAESSR